MTKDEVLTHFQNNFTSLKKMIFEIAFWTFEPNEDLCKPLAEGLQILASTGNKKAAVLYAVIAAYDNNAGCFSPKIASRLLFTHNAVDEYVSFIDEEFKDDVDADLYEFLYSFPAVSLLEEVAEDSLK